MKLAVYAIAKNEAAHVQRWFDSVKDADYITVVDTGSDDATMLELTRVAKLHPNFNFTQMKFEPFRFDTARNIALTNVPANVDYCMMLDMDETLPEGTIATVKAAIQDGTHDVYRLTLVYTFDHLRKPIVNYPREAIHRRWGFHWKHPVHELLARDDNKPYTYADIDALVYHEPDTAKSRAFYFDLLQIAVVEDPENPRHVQYLGREYMYIGDYFSAIQWLKRHVEREPHGPFRSESARYIAECYLAMDGSLEEATDEAEAWLYRACAEHNSAREPFCALAQLYFSCGAYESAIGAVSSALRIQEPPQVNMIRVDEYYNGIWCEHMLAASYQNLGDNAKARSVIEAMLSKQGQKVELPQQTLNDIMHIFGVDHVTKSGTSETSEGGEGGLPQVGEDEAEALSGDVSPVQP